MKSLSPKRNVAVTLLVSLLLQSCGVGVPIRGHEELYKQDMPTLEVYASNPTRDISRDVGQKTQCVPHRDPRLSQLGIMLPPLQPIISRSSNKPSTCGSCQEIVSYTFTSQQGYTVHFAYSGSTWKATVTEQLGSFSRSSMLPIVCEDHGNIGQLLSRLESKPAKYVQRHIHVAHNQQITGPGSFVYLGRQGLRGGGDDNQASERKEITSVKALVEALNNAGPYDRAELEEQVRRCIEWFNDQCVDNLILRPVILKEYVNLAHIPVQLENPTNRELLESYFRSLIRKVPEIEGQKPILMQAIRYTLRSMGNTVFQTGFQDDRDVLTRLANKLLNKLDPKEVSFSRENYSTYHSTLYTLCETLLLISELDQWDPGHQGGIYQKFADQLESIEKAPYYPFKYDAQLLGEILKHLKIPKPKAECVSKRAISGLKAIVYLTGCIDASFPHIKLEPDKFSTGIVHLIDALGRGTSFKAWYTDLADLTKVTAETLQDAEKYVDFKKYLEKAKPKGGFQPSEDNKKAFYFSIVRELSLLALHSPTPRICRDSINELSDLGRVPNH